MSASHSNMIPGSNSLTFHPKKSSAIWLLLVCLILVAVGVLMAQEKGWGGYLFAAFFALGIPVGIVQLLPGSRYLHISEDGLSFASMFRVTTIPWDMIDRFFVVSLTGMAVNKMVGFNFVPSYGRSQIGRRINFAIAQCEGVLPELYGEKAEELAATLNTWLDSFSQRHGEQSVGRQDQKQVTDQPSSIYFDKSTRWLFAAGILIGGISGYFIAGAEGRALGGGIGAALGPIIGRVIVRKIRG
jgi:hypothetical protein